MVDTRTMRKKVEPLVFYVDGRSTLSPQRPRRSRSPQKNQMRYTSSTPEMMRVVGSPVGRTGSPSMGMDSSFASGSDDELSIYTNGFKPKHSINTWNMPRQIRYAS